MFYLYIPFHGIESRLAEAFESLEDAKQKAQDACVYGYAVCDGDGNFVWSPAGSAVASHILYHAKCVADYMREHGYKYGDADQNPALDKHSAHPEKIVSCDRFSGWVLYEAGYVDHQPLRNWPHGMDDIFARQIITLGYLGITSFTATKRSAFSKKLRSSSSMYTAINASSTEQFLVGCINDSIYFHFRYVVSNNI